jgi:membrane protein implicated in regulation of membrane protease activity
VAELGLESNILKAANPVAWLRIVSALGVLYGLVLLVIVGYALALALLFRFDLWLPLELALGMFAILSIFSFLGGALYERRHELGLETWVSPERTEELLRQEERKKDDLIVMEAYGLMRVDSHIKCWQTLNDWLKSRGNTPEDYRWLCERVTSWEDPRYVTRLTQDYLERLLALKRTGDALDGLAHRFKQDASFRPKSAKDTLILARLAAHGGKRSLGRSLLADFATRFTGDPLTAEADALARRLGGTP